MSLYGRTIVWRRHSSDAFSHAYLTATFEGKAMGFGDAVCRNERLGEVRVWKDDGPPCVSCVRKLHDAISKMSLGQMADMLTREQGAS